MDIDKIEEEYRTFVGKDKEGPSWFQKLQFELLLEIVKELRATRENGEGTFGREPG